MPPKNFVKVPLNEICNIEKGDLITEKTSVPGNIPVIAGGVKPPYYHNTPNRPANTITISGSGNAGYVSFHKKPIFASDCSTITPSKNYDVKFLYYSLLNCQTELYALQTGGAQLHVYPEHLRLFQITYVRDIHEQKAIATALSDVDGLIENIERLIAKKCDVKTAAMQVLLTGKKRLAGFSGEWTEKCFGDLLGYEQPTNYLVTSTNYNEQGDIAVLTANKSFVLGYTNEQGGIFENVPVIIGIDDFITASKFVDFPFKVKSSALKILKVKSNAANLRFVFERMQIVHFHFG